MDLPWWGWVLVGLWLVAGLCGFVVFLRRFESPYAVWYYLIGDEEFRGPFRTISRSIPLIAVFLFCLFLGPIGVVAEVQTQREEKLEIARRERLWEERRQRKVAAEAARAAAAQASDDQ